MLRVMLLSSRREQQIWFIDVDSEQPQDRRGYVTPHFRLVTFSDGGIYLVFWYVDIVK